LESQGGSLLKYEKITISDIAKTLDISIVSVSRALAGQPGISSALKEKILARAKEMGYRKTPKSTPANILVLHQKPYLMDRSNSSLLLQEIEKALQNANLDYHMEFIDKLSQERLEPPYKLSKGSNFAGVLFIGRFEVAYLNLIRESIKNVTLVTGYSAAWDCDIIRHNFTHAGYRQCEYLIKKGHTRIVFLGDLQLFHNQERLLGIMAAYRDHKLPMEQLSCWDSLAQNPAKLDKLFASQARPTAVICNFDHTAIELVKLLHQKNITVPNALSLIGWGNTEMANLAIPALTTMDLNIEYLCEVAVNTILQRINRPDQPYRTIGILSRLVERDSVQVYQES
jgi:LacI family transcriptional regulator